MNYRIEVNKTRFRGSFTTIKQVSNYLYKQFGLSKRYTKGLLDLAEIRQSTAPIEIKDNDNIITIVKFTHYDATELLEDPYLVPKNRPKGFEAGNKIKPLLQPFEVGHDDKKWLQLPLFSLVCIGLSFLASYQLFQS